MLPKVSVRSRAKWRAWLRKHHASSEGVWLVYHKQHTGVKSVDYDDSVREALCFGWVDSLIKRLDSDTYARKFTPRRPGSKWSASNRLRWKELAAAGLLSTAGLAASPSARDGSAPAIPNRLPTYIAGPFKRNAAAWRYFQALPKSRRRDFVLWISTAKRPETRAKRVAESIRLLVAGKPLGLK